MQTKNRKIAFVLSMALLLAASYSHAALGDLTVDVPKTAYIDWLTASSDAMDSVDGDNTFAFDPYVGGAVTQLTQPADKVVYLGVMCNALTGYEVSFNAGGSATATTGQMTIAGGQPVVFTGTLSKVTASFSAGTTASTALDFTGATVSGDTVHTAEADLPLAAASPNVWQLSLALPVISTVADGLIMSGTYAGGITATVALK